VLRKGEKGRKSSRQRGMAKGATTLKNLVLRPTHVRSQQTELWLTASSKNGLEESRPVEEA